MRAQDNGNHAGLPRYIQAWLRDHPVHQPGQPRPTSTENAAASDLDRYRVEMRRFAQAAPRLPYETKLQCPTCSRIVPARFLMIDGRVVLEQRCDTCGASCEAHHDAIFTRCKPDWPDSPEATFSGTPIRPVVRGLPRTVRTLCPNCAAILLGRYYVRDGAVWIEKHCPEHGHFRDKIHSNVDLYLKCAAWSFDEGRGVLSPQVHGAAHCPSDCGLCNQHQTVAVLGQIDLTNRCNLTCPICFANANVSKRIYEPTLDHIVEMLQQLLDLRPAPCTSVQFSGGEPTIHPRFFDILAKARDMGFANIQIATNGITMAEADFARRAREAGLHTLYLQFDGLDDGLYQTIRGRSLLEIKKQVVANCRRVGLKVCLVPTIVKGQNDDQVGPIIQFAVDNIDVISAISWQPVVFTGRISPRDLELKRYTLGDLCADIAAATGADLRRDFYPLSIVAPLCDLLSALERKPKIRPSCHPDCAEGTYFFVAPPRYEGQPARERLTPIPRVFDVEGLFVDMKRLADRLGAKEKVGLLDKLRVVCLFARHFNRKAAPPGLTLFTWLRSLRGMLDKTRGRGSDEARHYRTLLCAGMHFMDRYNYDAQRVRRCAILYSTPRGVFPFCTYNSGPCYREYVERLSSMSLDEWQARSDGQVPVGLALPTAVG